MCYDETSLFILSCRVTHPKSSSLAPCAPFKLDAEADPTITTNENTPATFMLQVMSTEIDWESWRRIKMRKWDERVIHKSSVLCQDLQIGPFKPGAFVQERIVKVYVVFVHSSSSDDWVNGNQTENRSCLKLNTTTVMRSIQHLFDLEWYVTLRSINEYDSSVEQWPPTHPLSPSTTRFCQRTPRSSCLKRGVIGRVPRHYQLER